ncbi:MAG: 50S ribosomal protein L9 [Flammeovirgaceae bacterium]|nr:50S ribosomal protein L9 [Flammeovirgaceae bacterium]|tara:strand:- start:3813 stop:4406 length:594 start_codon:yes stop_codon:yes gene_type:complete
MKLILIKDVPGLGFQDEKVNVKDGYGRNFLIPKGLGVLANKSNSRVLEEKLKQTVKKQEEILKSAEKIANKIGDLNLEIKLKSGADDKVFGSVTTAQITKILSEKGFEIDKRNVTLSSKVNSTGEYTIFLKLHKDVTHEIILNVTGTNPKKKKKKVKEVKKEESDSQGKESKDIEINSSDKPDDIEQKSENDTSKKG